MKKQSWGLGKGTVLLCSIACDALFGGIPCPLGGVTLNSVPILCRGSSEMPLCTCLTLTCTHKFISNGLRVVYPCRWKSWRSKALLTAPSCLASPLSLWKPPWSWATSSASSRWAWPACSTSSGAGARMRMRLRMIYIPFFPSRKLFSAFWSLDIFWIRAVGIS